MSSRKDNYFSILDTGNMFEDSGHRTRFKELLDCYGDFPFFSKGLCKCMYLSAWDEEHFCIMLEILTDLSLGRETSTREMRVKGEALAQGGQYVYHIAGLESGKGLGAGAPDLEHKAQRALFFVYAADGDGAAQGVAGNKYLGELAGDRFCGQLRAV